LAVSQNGCGQKIPISPQFSIGEIACGSKELPGAEQKLPGQDKFLSALSRPPAGPYAVEKLEISTTTPDYDSYQLRLGVHPHRISQHQLCNLPSSPASFGLS
jgi:hypothetical protein